MPAVIDNKSSFKRYLIPLEGLDSRSRQRYLTERGIISIDTVRRQPPPAQHKEKRFDEYSAEERETAALWQRIVREWQVYRRDGRGSLEQIDAAYIDRVRLEHPELRISRRILYRRAEAVKSGSISGLVEKRGKYNKGQHNAPQEIFDLFMWYWLDQRRPKVPHCIESTVMCLEEAAPELLVAVPSEATFRRYLETVGVAVKMYGRYGNKAYDDSCKPYIERLYTDIYSNTYWIADNHTLDIISRSVDGASSTHRLSLTMFLDARSGMPTGWNLTDNPNGQSTILALRHGIMRTGCIPDNIYVDNGREFLVHDIGGLGHRRKSNVDYTEYAPPIFERLGIKMTNALPRNAKAKPIERTFRDITWDIAKLFETYCGGSIMERPESLKQVLKSGRVPLDSEIRVMLDDLIEGYYSNQPYGGKVSADKGLTKREVYNAHLPDKVRMPTEGELDLMLMRTTRAQKIGRNGVKITIAGEVHTYGYAELQDYIGKSVYVRYEPSDMESVRVYSAPDDVYMMTVTANAETLLKYGATQDDVATAQRSIAKVKAHTRAEYRRMRDAVPAERRLDALDLRLRKARSADRTLATAERVELVMTSETLAGNEISANGATIEIDLRAIDANIGYLQTIKNGGA